MWQVVNMSSPLLMILVVSSACIAAVDLKILDTTEFFPEKQYLGQACHNKIFGTQGFISSPLVYQPNTTCRWDLDVTKGHVAVLEFEYLRLPDSEEGTCDSYVQISYGAREDQITGKFCASDELERIYTDSQVVVIKAVHRGTCQAQCNEEFGFKIHYSGIATISTPAVVSPIVIIGLIMSLLLSIAFLAFCFSCRSKRFGSISPREGTRQPLEDIVEFQRHITPAQLQEPRKLSFSIFQNETARYSSNLRRWASNSRLDKNKAFTSVQRPAPARQISIATTPRTIFPNLRKKWSDSSIERILHVKTRLASRFSTTSSSHNSSDISVYFPASDPMCYSQLRSEEDDNRPHEEERKRSSESSRSASTSGRIPSIVIELVD